MPAAIATAGGLALTFAPGFDIQVNGQTGEISINGTTIAVDGTAISVNGLAVTVNATTTVNSTAVVNSDVVVNGNATFSGLIHGVFVP